MTACTIRYRLDGPGPSTFLVECDGELRVYTRGRLGGVVSRSQVLASLAARGMRWIPAAGQIELDLAAEERAMRRADASLRRSLDPTVVPTRPVEPPELSESAG